MRRSLGLLLLLLAACSSENAKIPAINQDSSGDLAAYAEVGVPETQADLEQAETAADLAPMDLPAPDTWLDLAPETSELVVEPEDVPVVPDICIPNCDGIECGPDGCSGSCGTCPLGSECSDDALCVAIVCADDADCPELLPVCDLATASCVACLQDGHCPEGTYCNAMTCLPGECNPGDLTCAANKVVECLEEGLWGPPVSCPKNKFCADGACVPTVCEPGSSVCEGNTIVMCNDIGSEIAEVLPCSDNQYCAYGICYKQVCPPSTLLCKNDAVLACNENGSALNTVETCGYGTYCEAGQCLAMPCGALQLNGTDDYVTIPDTAALQPGTSFTIAFWFKFAAGPQERLVLRKGASQASVWIWLKKALYLKYGIYKGTNAYGVDSTQILEPGLWYHFAMTYDGVAVAGYINGSLDATKAVPGGGAPNTNAEALTIGYGYPDMFTNAFFGGALDDMVYYNSVLTPEAVKKLMEQGPWADDSLVGHWSFNDFSGSVAADGSGNGIDGQVTGGTWLEDGWQCIAP
jgi:hypothetical protein